MRYTLLDVERGTRKDEFVAFFVLQDEHNGMDRIVVPFWDIRSNYPMLLPLVKQWDILHRKIPHGPLYSNIHGPLPSRWLQDGTLRVTKSGLIIWTSRNHGYTRVHRYRNGLPPVPAPAAVVINALIDADDGVVPPYGGTLPPNLSRSPTDYVNPDHIDDQDSVADVIEHEPMSTATQLMYAMRASPHKLRGKANQIATAVLDVLKRPLHEQQVPELHQGSSRY